MGLPSSETLSLVEINTPESTSSTATQRACFGAFFFFLQARESSRGYNSVEDLKLKYPEQFDKIGKFPKPATILHNAEGEDQVSE